MKELKEYYRRQFAQTSVPAMPSDLTPAGTGKLQNFICEALTTVGLLLILLFSFSEPNTLGNRVQEGTVRYLTSLKKTNLADVPEAIAVNILILKPYLGGTHDQQ